MKHFTLSFLFLFIFSFPSHSQNLACGESTVISTVGGSNNIDNYTHTFSSLTGPENSIQIDIPTMECTVCLNYSGATNSVRAMLTNDPSDPTATKHFPLNSGEYCFNPIPGQDYYIIADGNGVDGGEISVEMTCSDMSCTCEVDNSNSLSEGLVSYWTFDGDLIDQVGSNDGIAVGSELTYTGGRYGDGIDLNSLGMDPSYVNVGNDPSLNFTNRSMTVSAWVRVDAITRPWQTIISKGEACDYRMFLWRNEEFVAWNAREPDVLGTTSINDGEFHHIAAVTDFDINYKAIYVDGVLEGVVSFGTDICDSNNDLLIGENPIETGRIWNGVIDDIAMWDRALCQNEIVNLFQSTRPLEDIVAASIPTLSQWAIIITFLGLIIIGIIVLKSGVVQKSRIS